MKYRVVFLESAVEDLKEIRRFVRKHFSEAVWRDSYDRIKKAILKLERFPRSGHALEELPCTQYLETIVERNRVIYELQGDTVFIHIICDSRQDFRIRLARRPIRSLLPALRRRDSTAPGKPTVDRPASEIAGRAVPGRRGAR